VGGVKHADKGIQTGMITTSSSRMYGFLIWLLTTCLAVAQGSVTFQNLTPITILDYGRANPYPSTITVSDVGLVQDIKVHLYGLSHSFPGDLDVFLVRPRGLGVLLMSDAGKGYYPRPPELPLFDLDFADEAESSLPAINEGFLVSGEYRPTDYDCPLGDSDSFLADSTGFGIADGDFTGSNHRVCFPLLLAEELKPRSRCGIDAFAQSSSIGFLACSRPPRLPF
jgi:hypothetical protein